MRIQPRQQLLEIWRATARTSVRDGKWTWGGREESNSISDAEQLLCILLPATEVRRLRLDRPDETDEDVLAALQRLGGALEIPRLLISAIKEYLERYDTDGTPDFSGGSYFESLRPGRSITPDQASLDVVESFAVSITLTLATLGFTRTFAREVTRQDTLAEIAVVERLAKRRLTAAMVGLMRSFTINVFDPFNDQGERKDYGRRLIRTVNQSEDPPHIVVNALQRRLRDIAAGLRDLRIGSGRMVEIDDQFKLFECGWTWGISEDAPAIDFVEDIGAQREGYALDAPYLYFTVVALDGIADLFSERTLRLGLLDETQQRLARALEIRWELTQQYWAAIASFGDGRWPLEDIPWKAVDGQESDYFTLMVTSIAARGLAERNDSNAGLRRLFNVVTELANRERITRRPVPGDQGMLLHSQGLEIQLEGETLTGDREMRWVATDFAPLLLKRSIRLANMTDDITLRADLQNLSNQVWQHAQRRRLNDGPARDLWDQPQGAFPEIELHYEQPSWHHTLRIMESLVLAAELVETTPLVSTQLTNVASELLGEAEHLFNQQQLSGATEGGSSIRSRLGEIGADLDRAKEILLDRPGSAVALLLQVVAGLDRLTAARQAGDR